MVDVRRTELGRRTGAGPAGLRTMRSWPVKMLSLLSWPSTWRHADGTVEPDGLAVEIGVAIEFEHQAAEFLWLAEAFRERNRGGQPLEYLWCPVLYSKHRRRGKDAGHDRVTTNTEIHEITRDGEDQPVHARLAAAIGDLPDLRILRGGGRRQGDAAAFAIFEWLQARHTQCRH